MPYEWTGEVMHTWEVTNSILVLMHIQLRTRVTRLTAQGVCNISARLKDWNVNPATRQTLGITNMPWWWKLKLSLIIISSSVYHGTQLYSAPDQTQKSNVNFIHKKKKMDGNVLLRNTKQQFINNSSIISERWDLLIQSIYIDHGK